MRGQQVSGQKMSPGLSSCQGCQVLSGTVKGTVTPLSRPLSRSTVNTVRPLSGHCQVILTVTMRVAVKTVKPASVKLSRLSSAVKACLPLPGGVLGGS